MRRDKKFLVDATSDAAGPLGLFYLTTTATVSAYPKLKDTPNVYPAKLITAPTFGGGPLPSGAGAITIDPGTISDDSDEFVVCGSHFLPQYSIVLCATIGGVNYFVAAIDGARFEQTLNGTLTADLATGGTAPLSVIYMDANGGTVADTPTVTEWMGLGSSSPIKSGSKVTAAWSLCLQKWLAIAANCAS